MTEFEDKLCYSPFPPTKYAKLIDGTPVGPAGVAVDRAIGSPIMRKYGLDEMVETGIHVWNLAWLITPEFDRLPKASLKAYPEVAHYTPEQWHEIIQFAAGFENALLGSPVAFLKRLQKMKVSLPLGFQFGKAMVRARAAEGVSVAFASANVVKVDFKRKQA